MFEPRFAGLVGEQEVIRWADTLVRGMQRDIPRTLDRGGDSMVQYARNNHPKWQSMTGEADKSIKHTVEVRKKVATLTFFIDPRGVMTSTGYNRTWILNDGTYGRYRRGKISPTANTVGGKAGTGIRHSDMMGRAWTVKSKVLERRLRKIFDRIR